MHQDYKQLADRLLNAVPEELRDVPSRLLDGETPRQAAAHVAEAGCLACRYSLVDIAEAS
jgi:hypothetical protein